MEITKNENNQKWKKIQQSVSITSKITTRVSSENFIGEDLKFADNSPESLTALTLQLGINHSIDSGKQNSGQNNQNSLLFKSPLRSLSFERLDSSSLESINKPLDDQKAFSITVNGEDCEFVEYFPEIFMMIRSVFDIDPIEYRAVLGLNAEANVSKLETLPTSKSANSLSDLDKKLNATLKEAVHKTETTFKNLSQKLLNEGNTSEQTPKNLESQDHQTTDNKLLAKFSEVTSKFRTSFDPSKPTVSPSETDPAPETPRSMSSDPSMIRSTLRFIGTRDASGKSSSWFLFSPDMRYCCKTAKASEAELLMKILPSYAMHCQSFPDSLLPHFYGLYRICVMGETYWFIIQGNVFASPKPISERYDVKGSTHGRAASEKEKAKGVHAIHKDLDLINNERFLCLENQSQKDQLIQTLSRDVQWLESHSLMDYSFLIGFVDSNDESPLSRRSKDRFAIKSIPLVDERFSSAYVGIIDILTEYQLKKKIETFVTGRLLFQPGISCQPPEKYAQRMIEFVDAITLVVPQHEANELQSSATDTETLHHLRQERKKYFEEYIERNSKGLDWIKETTSDLTEKAQVTLLTEIEKIKDLLEKKNEEETKCDSNAV